MINNFIYDDISNAILNTNTALNEITSSITSATAKPYFILNYSRLCRESGCKPHSYCI